MARNRLLDIFGGGQSNAVGSGIGSAYSTDRIGSLTAAVPINAGGKRMNVDSALAAGLQEAGRLARTADENTAAQLAFLQDEQALASQPTITDRDIDRQFGAAADRSAVDAQALMKSLRSQMGQSGVSGGTAAGIGAQVELQRLGQMTDAKRDLQMFKANADAQDRIGRYQRAFGIGEVMGREPSPFLSDALQSLVGVRLYQQELGMNYDLGKMNLDAQKDAQPEWWETALGIGASFIPNPFD